MTDQNQTQRFDEDDESDEDHSNIKRPCLSLSPKSEMSEVNKEDIIKEDTTVVALHVCKPTSPLTDDSSDDDLFEKPENKLLMRQQMMKEFFVRAFLAKKYPIPSNIYNYESFMPLVSVQVSAEHEARWEISTSEQSVVDHLVEFYRTRRNTEEGGKRHWFSSCVLKKELVVFEATKEDVQFILRDFWCLHITLK